MASSEELEKAEHIELENAFVLQLFYPVMKCIGVVGWKLNAMDQEKLCCYSFTELPELD